jgi:hypothetical protein
MKNTLALIVTSGILILAGGCAQHRAGKWEYKTVTVTNDSDEQINHLADEGWKVESFTATFPSAGSLFKVYLLKRPKQ